MIVTTLQYEMAKGVKDSKNILKTKISRIVQTGPIKQRGVCRT